MRLRHRLGLIGLLTLVPGPVGADDPPSEAARVERRDRLDFMKAKLGDSSLVAVGPPPAPLTLAEEPALRWTNPVRGVDGDGATFFWTEGDRPVAVATISIRAGGKVFREFALIGDRPIEARRGGNVVWSPRRNALPFAPLDDAPIPAKPPPSGSPSSGRWPGGSGSTSSRGSRRRPGSCPNRSPDTPIPAWSMGRSSPSPRGPTPKSW